METLAQFHFLRPWFLLGLIPVLFIWLRLMFSRKRFSNWEQVCDKHLLPHLLLNRAERHDRLPLLLIGLVWTLSVLILAGPSWSKSSYALYRHRLAQVLAIDLSHAIVASDIRPNRITRLRYKLQDLVKNNPSQIGMIAFTQESFTISPLTEDAYTLSALIPELDPNIMPIQGTNLAQAIRASAKLFEQSGEPKGHIILITSSTPTEHDLKTAQQIHEQGYQVSVYGFGTKQGAPLLTEQGFLKDHQGNIRITKIDSQALKSLADAGGGHYVGFTDNDHDIQTLKSLSQHQNAEKSKQKIAVWNDQGYWLLFFLLPIVGLAFRRGWFETIVG